MVDPSNREHAAEKIEKNLISTYGMMLSREQLADLLDRRIGGLNWELAREESQLRRELGPSMVRFGRRVYYSAPELALILAARLGRD